MRNEQYAITGVDCLEPWCNGYELGSRHKNIEFHDDLPVLPAPGIPGQNKVGSCPSTQDRNSRDSMNHWPVPSWQPFIMSLCCAEGFSGHSQSMIASFLSSSWCVVRCSTPLCIADVDCLRYSNINIAIQRIDLDTRTVVLEIKVPR